MSTTSGVCCPYFHQFKIPVKTKICTARSSTWDVIEVKLYFHGARKDLWVLVCWQPWHWCVLALTEDKLPTLDAMALTYVNGVTNSADVECTFPLHKLIFICRRRSLWNIKRELMFLYSNQHISALSLVMRMNYLSALVIWSSVAFSK